ncbi:MAG: hypothetical protein QGF20_10720, partial [Alphaproteobacteria bacterium]|nr:hypothetical protein [Alphaproteobacteria bacterium]
MFSEVLTQFGDFFSPEAQGACCAWARPGARAMKAAAAVKVKFRSMVDPFQLEPGHHEASGGVGSGPDAGGQSQNGLDAQVLKPGKAQKHL